MSIEKVGEDQFVIRCGVDDLKRIYRAVFSTLRADHLMDMDESDLLIDIQTVLQQEAVQVGVDISHHSEWDRFLGTAEPIPCEQRYARYNEKKQDV